MNRTRMLVLAAIALVLSLAVTFVVYGMLRDRLQPGDETVRIAVAAQNLTVGQRLTEADVRLANWPRAVAIEGTFNDLTAVIGRGAIVPMIANEPILESKLARKDGGAGLIAAIPEGMRAMAVKVNDVIGVAGFVLPGSRVDVILSGSPERNNEMEMSKVILENLQVLSAGQTLESTDAEGKPLNVQVVTLLVTPEQSQKLALASVEGKIQLALRNSMDHELPNPTAVHRESLYGNASSSALAAAPAPPAPSRKAARATPPPPPPPAPEPVVAKPEEPAKPAPIELQLIQGSKIEKVVFLPKQ